MYYIKRGGVLDLTTTSAEYTLHFSCATFPNGKIANGHTIIGFQTSSKFTYDSSTKHQSLCIIYYSICTVCIVAREKSGSVLPAKGRETSGEN